MRDIVKVVIGEFTIETDLTGKTVIYKNSLRMRVVTPEIQKKLEAALEQIVTDEN